MEDLRARYASEYHNDLEAVQAWKRVAETEGHAVVVTGLIRLEDHNDDTFALRPFPLASVTVDGANWFLVMELGDDEKIVRATQSQFAVPVPFSYAGLVREVRFSIRSNLFNQAAYEEVVAEWALAYARSGNPPVEFERPAGPTLIRTEDGHMWGAVAHFVGLDDNRYTIAIAKHRDRYEMTARVVTMSSRTARIIGSIPPHLIGARQG